MIKPVKAVGDIWKTRLNRFPFFKTSHLWYNPAVFGLFDCHLYSYHSRSWEGTGLKTGDFRLTVAIGQDRDVSLFPLWSHTHTHCEECGIWGHRFIDVCIKPGDMWGSWNTDCPRRKGVGSVCGHSHTWHVCSLSQEEFPPRPPLRCVRQ